MFKRLMILMLFFTGLTACEQEEMQVKFLEINDAGIATFTIENTTEKDITSLTTELTYFSEFDRAIMIDTVDHAMKDRSKAFLKAGEETFITQQVPEGTISATGKVLNYELMGTDSP